MSHRKKNSLTRRVRLAYSQRELTRICTMPERDFGTAFDMKTVEIDRASSFHQRDDSYYHFRDQGSRVLAVAHLDTVVNPDRREPHFRVTQQAGTLVVCGALDDRLGAYTILDLLPKLGVTCDQLLTVGEESCASTAEYFTSGKDYDWVIEFDRGGTDVVMYQYEDHASRLAVQAAGARVGSGSFSDIAYLEQLRVKAFNWGIGYEGNYHSERGYAFLDNTFAMVAKYLRFHAQNAGTAMPHESSYKSYGSYRDDDTWTCQVCGAKWAVDPDSDICDVCNYHQDCYMHQEDCQCYTTHALSGKPVDSVLEGLADRERARRTPVTRQTSEVIDIAGYANGDTERQPA